MKRTIRSGNIKFARIYDSQMARCNNTNSKAFVNYGAKGIKVEYSAEDFIRWCIKNFPLDRSSICVGRKDHSKNYSLDNIQIETRSESTSERNERLGNPSVFRERAVESINIYTGKVEQRFPSVKRAAERYQMTSSRIIEFCKNKRNKARIGITFRYVEELSC